MEYQTIIIAVIALFLGVILSFLFTSKSRRNKEGVSDQSAKEDDISLEKPIGEDALILQKELSKLKEELSQSEVKISRSLLSRPKISPFANFTALLLS